MKHRFVPVAILLVASALVVLPPLTGTASATTYGPSDPYTKELNSPDPVTPLKNQAMITRTQYGWRYRAGQQNSHLVITVTSAGQLRFEDRGTQKWRSLASSCQRRSADKGIAAVCPIPSDTSSSNHMLLEVWPRLGDDYVDGSSLPSTIDMTVLTDAGNDIAKTGAGNDFINGAMGRDRAAGGPGNDWIRTGKGKDHLWGGDGADMLVGVYDDDAIHGGGGNDQVYGGDGNDTLWTDAGSDFASCGGGRDGVWADSADRVSRECEVVNH